MTQSEHMTRLIVNALNDTVLAKKLIEDKVWDRLPLYSENRLGVITFHYTKGETTDLELSSIDVSDGQLDFDDLSLAEALEYWNDTSFEGNAGKDMYVYLHDVGTIRHSIADLESVLTDTDYDTKLSYMTSKTDNLKGMYGNYIVENDETGHIIYRAETISECLAYILVREQMESRV